MRAALHGRALILAAHGSRHEPGVNHAIEVLAERVGERLGLDEAAAAFHQGTPAFSSVLDRLAAVEVVLVPFFTSEGYYSDVVLSRELEKNRRHALVRVRATPALGVHPGLAELVLGRVRRLEAQYALESPAVALVAHGTPRHRRSRRSAEDLASRLRRRAGVEAVAFFLDEAPRVEEVPATLAGRDVIVEPFLIGAGRHATRDLARRLDLDESVAGEVSVGEHDGARLVLDRPLGEDPGIEALVLDLARAAASEASSTTVKRPSRER